MSVIRPNNNTRSQGLPIDDEVEAVIVTPYAWDSDTEEWVPNPVSVVGEFNSESIETKLDTINNSLEVLRDTAGGWSYQTGTSGTETIAEGFRVVGIVCHSKVGGTLVIDGGEVITIPSRHTFTLSPNGQVEGPLDIVFSGTDRYVIELLEGASSGGGGSFGSGGTFG